MYGACCSVLVVRCTCCEVYQVVHWWCVGKRVVVVKVVVVIVGISGYGDKRKVFLKDKTIFQCNCRCV